MKKLLILMLALTLTLNFVGCGEKKADAPAEKKTESSEAKEEKAVEIEEAEEEKNDKESPAKEKINPNPVSDKELVGMWKCIDGTVNGDYFPGYIGYFESLSYFDINFTFDSVATGSIFTKMFSEGVTSEYDISGNKITLKDIPDEDITLEMTYSIDSLSETKAYHTNESIEKYYAEGNGRQLTLHITGTYTGDHTSEKDIDATFVYEKAIHQGSIYARNMVGDWKDSMGNEWTFTEYVSDNSYSARSNAVSFEMVSKKGDTYTGTIDFESWNDNEKGLQEGITVNYDAEQEDFQANLNSIDETKLDCTKRNGDDISFTRN